MGFLGLIENKWGKKWRKRIKVFTKKKEKSKFFQEYIFVKIKKLRVTITMIPFFGSSFVNKQRKKFCSHSFILTTNLNIYFLKGILRN